MQRRPSQPLDTALFVLALGYCGFAMLTETGPYRWLVELQGRWFGAHYPRLTLLAMIVAAGIAVAVVAPLVRRIAGGGAGAARPAMSIRAQRWLAALAGLGFACAAGVTGWRAAQASGTAPVELPGTARRELAVTVESGGVASDYIPLTPPTWQPGQPVTVVLRRAHSDAPPHGPWRGALVEGALPALARPAFDKLGVALGAPLYVLDDSPLAAGRGDATASLVLGALALACLIAALVLGRGRRASRAAVTARAAGGPGSRAAGS